MVTACRGLNARSGDAHHGRTPGEPGKVGVCDSGQTQNRDRRNQRGAEEMAQDIHGSQRMRTYDRNNAACQFSALTADAVGCRHTEESPRAIHAQSR